MTYHIHIKGIVQGVGFRPFVYKLAIKQKLKGNVNNTSDGVHINLNGDKSLVEKFITDIVKYAPDLAIITDYSFEETRDIDFLDFQIIHSESNVEPNLLLTPDFALCDDCRQELKNPKDKRFNYPFITCTNCGPRYSIITGLPYDREPTTMASFKMCNNCRNEYDDPLDRRYYSQTNSCDECGIKISIYENGKYISTKNEIDFIVKEWESGKIIGIKGIGGYLLTCDATNSNTIKKLRKRKYRPSKPFALMYPDLKTVKEDAEVSKFELKELSSVSSPIVLLKLKPKVQSSIDVELIANGLDRIGVMMPYAPIFELLLYKFKKPIIATSGNISNSTIIYENEKAIEELTEIADIIISNNRDIVIPQDDSVVKFTDIFNEKIIIRRSRGLAPSYINNQIKSSSESILATGAMLKSAFTLLNKNNIYISQFLGNTDSFDAQLNYKKTLNHFFDLLNPKLNLIYVDKHPAYFSSNFGNELAKNYKIKVQTVQHHKAHFTAILGENNLLDTKEKILGVIFDGTGYGDDGNIWGGEFFTYQNKTIERFHHVDYFDFILGDKMVLEPRISALVISKNLASAKPILKNKFTNIEWKVYSKIIEDQPKLKSSSIGRLFDAASSFILDIDKQTYEGEAAMKMESVANEYIKLKSIQIADSYINDENNYNNFPHLLLEYLIDDINNGGSKSFIAAKFHISIVHYIRIISNMSGARNIAFSGGVFQNGIIVDLINKFMKNDFNLFFHKQLSPNDECISFGQLLYGINKIKS